MEALFVLASQDKFAPLAATIKALHYAFPALVFFAFVTALTITVCTLQTQALRIRDQHVRRDAVFGLLIFVVGTYIAEVIIVAAQALADSEWSPGQDRVVYLLASILTFGLQILLLSDTKFPVWYPYFATWFIAIPLELVLLILSNLCRHPRSAIDIVLIVIRSCRIIGFVGLPALYFGLRNSKSEYGTDDAESQALLRKKLAPKQSSSENGNGYGSTDATNQQSDTADDVSDAGSEDSWLARQQRDQERVSKRLQNDGSWWTYAKGFSVFIPHIWPVHSKRLQFRAVLVGICLLGSNALNVLVPRQLGIMIDTLTKYSTGEDTARNLWLPVVTYTALLFISGGGCIGWLKKWLWMPLEQYSYDALSTASHAHIMSLSSDFHDNKTSSDLNQAIAGGRSVSDLLDMICFQVIPMLIDLSVAFAYLWSLFGPYMGFVMVTTVITYFYVTTKLVAARADKRREYITVFRKEWTIGQQSLDSWTTASLFNMIPYEQSRYKVAVKDHLKQKRLYELSSQLIGAAQGLIMTLGLLGALYLAVFQVIKGEKTVGEFATLLTYWAALQGPLMFFSTIYRSISYSLMDAERLLELFQTKPSIKDSPNAKPLKLGQGHVQFDRVSFAYDERKPTLKNVSFDIAAGKTVALVGETGGGKSTILKLIDRFYDVNSGSIRIDGQDIRDVTLYSLRSKIGVVPQDPMLFNDTIMNNLRYARITASDKEVFEACKAAVIHDKIMSFPDGYKSKVGDRGVKLSGGEKQRVAIARAMLKQPEIILLDEATSAVDTETEHLIQEGLKNLCQSRTTFIVAHRLSTIMRADHILVVMNGEIIESGSHSRLLASKGKYFDLWTKQMFLKPPTDRSRSRSPKKQTAVVNDLPLALHKAEIQKANAQKKAEKLMAKKDTSVPNNDGHISDGDKELESRVHVREGSKLKPDAPEFIPRSPEGHVMHLAVRDGQDIHKNSKERKMSSDHSVTDVESFEPEKMKTKRTRYNRRQHAKSEPSRVQGSTDGAQDSEMTLESSGEGLPMGQTSGQRRRVSAPSDPPTNSHDSRGSRTRRSRHWRLKNRSGENISGDGSAATNSARPSTDNSSHEAHNTTPAEFDASSAPSGTVRFAPGV